MEDKLVRQREPGNGPRPRSVGEAVRSIRRSLHLPGDPRRSPNPVGWRSELDGTNLGQHPTRLDSTGLFLEARIREYASHDVRHALMLLNVVEERADDAAEKSLGGDTLNGVDREPDQQAIATRKLIESWHTRIAEASLILENLMRNEIH